MADGDLDKMRDCPVMAAIGVIDGKWKPRILWALRPGPAHFGALLRATGASARMLSKSLRELEAAGLIDRTITTDSPPMASYSYADHGRTLIPALDALGAWGAVHAARQRLAAD